jgi:mono/diheme cytochrome c family protein
MLLAGAAALALACATSGGAPREAAGGSDRVAADADVQAALTRSCYGCHAESGQLPWQAKLAPSAWFAGAAREKLDFSTFHALPADRRSDALHAIQRVVSSGEMPPWDSVLFDGTEKLTPAEKDRVASWASEAEHDTTH